MKIQLMCMCVFVWGMMTTYAQQTPNVDEAKKAFEYLNKVRKNPGQYSKEIKVNLNKVAARPTLVWNDTLAKVAIARAADMAKRNYFGHIDPDGYGTNVKINKAGYKLNPSWIKEKNSNYFESLAAGVEGGVENIKYLILDEGTSSLGHRKHLLGMDDFNSKLVDIGIGYVEDPKAEYGVYVCIIIARHDW